MSKKKTNGKIGIYKIINLTNKKVYIGQSKSIFERWQEHKRDLNNNTHGNPHLQNAWNKYGKEYFEFGIVEECSMNQLNEKEIYWIDYYNSMNSKFGYNKTSGGGANTIISDETKKKLSIAHSGENNYFYGKTHTEETKSILSEIAKIRFKDKRNHPSYGFKKSIEAIKKQSISMMGKYRGENTHLSKLNNNDVIEIKELLTNSYLSISDIANRYNISNSVIFHIRKIRIWKDIGNEYNNYLLECVKNDRIMIPIKLIIDIKHSLAYTNMPLSEIVIKYKVDRHTLNNIIKENVGHNLFPELNDLIKNRKVVKKNGQLDGRILTNYEVMQIKKLILNCELSQLEIAKIYNVSSSLISYIKNNKRYMDIGHELNDELINVKSKNKKGAYSNSAKLNENDIKEIKRIYVETDLNIVEIGKLFNVDNSTISSILNKKTWSYINTQYDNKIKIMLNECYKFPNNRPKLTVEDVIIIKKMMYEDVDDQTIADYFSVSKSSINAIRVGRKWKSVKTEYDDFISKNKRCINKEIAKEIKELIANGYTKDELMVKYNISNKVIDNIIAGRSWQSA